MENIELLQKAGLTEKQAQVYRSLLELGQAGVQLIAEKAGLKRPTTYVILDELKLLGLVSVTPDSRRALFVAESPEHLLADLTKKTEILKRYLPELLAVHNIKTAKPKVQLHTGIAGLRHVYDSILQKSHIRLFGTVEGLSKLYPKWIEEFFEIVKEKQLDVRDIISSGGANESYIKKAKTLPSYKVKILPKEKAFLSDSVILEDRVIFFSFSTDIFCVEIVSKDISNSIKTLYDLVWHSS